MTNRKPELKVLIGIPGSGKSHWIIKNKYYLNYLIVCPDNIRRDVFGDISDQTNNSRVFDIALGMVRAGLLLRQDVILDATNCNTKYRQEFLEKMPFCKKVAVLFDISPEIATERIKHDLREDKLRSAVPSNVVYRMYGEYLYTKKVLKKEFNSIEIVKQER